MRNAQIERLQSLKKKMDKAWRTQDGAMNAESFSADVEELIDILLMEREGMDEAG